MSLLKLPVPSLRAQADPHSTPRPEIDDGFKSFPSGHSSLAFAGLGFLSLYLAAKMHLFDRRGVALKAWIAVAPLTGATLIAISRTMDNRHHATDVLIGSLLGFWISVLVYHLCASARPPFQLRRAFADPRPRGEQTTPPSSPHNATSPSHLASRALPTLPPPPPPLHRTTTPPPRTPAQRPTAPPPSPSDRNSNRVARRRKGRLLGLMEEVGEGWRGRASMGGLAVGIRRRVLLGEVRGGARRWFELLRFGLHGACGGVEREWAGTIERREMERGGKEADTSEENRWRRRFIYMAAW